MSKITYKDAGVDIKKGDALVEHIQKKVKSTYGEKVVSGVGGFACLYKIAENRFLAAGTDGVGTKLMLAQELNIHNTIGIDLVAMCINDVLCTGAKPLFFMDYLATGKLDLSISKEILDGIAEACLESEMPLIGGETAEMPDMYSNNEYDLAGFAIGEVSAENLLDGSKVKEGDSLIGLASSGFHSNGFSLLRKLIKKEEKALMKKLLTPTRIYWDIIKKINTIKDIKVSGLAHITGGGLNNITRINSQFNYKINHLPSENELSDFMIEIFNRSKLNHLELCEIFNMGVGLLIVTSTPQELCQLLKKEKEQFYLLGKVEKGRGKLIF